MSHPVFLSSSTFAHMPIGQQNQWSEFFQTASYELEANGIIPILWLMLFKPENLQWANFLDDLDHDQHDIEAELAQQQLDNNQYAYLITDQKSALLNLEQQKKQFIHIFGQEYTFSFDHFYSLIQQHFPDYILLRTSGLPLAPNDQSFFAEPLQLLEHGIPESERKTLLIQALQQDLKHHPEPSLFFYGVDHFQNQTIELAPQVNEPDALINSELEEIKEPETDTQKSSNLMLWFSIIIIALICAGIWFFKGSM